MEVYESDARICMIAAKITQLLSQLKYSCKSKSEICAFLILKLTTVSDNYRDP